MSDQIAPITAKDTIARWLAHPTGGPIIREFLSTMSQAQGGEGIDDITGKIQNLPLNSLVELSQGKFTQEAADELVRQANGGVIPEESAAGSSAARFAGKTVIVTGAASGIGKATAEQIIAEGGRVVAVDISSDRLEALHDNAPEGSVVAVTGDITNDADIESIVKAAGRNIDGLANIAGIMDGMLPLHEVDNDSWERVMAVNVTGTFKLSRAVVAAMLETGGGSVVNVASEASLRGNAAGTAYTASKHAVVGLTKSAAFLYGPNNIRTNAVAPGPTATGIEGDFKSEFGQKRLGSFMALIPPVTTAEVLAKSITWLLSDDSVNINGQIIASDGGWSAQ